MRILRAALCVALARPCHAEPQCESAACRSADTVRSLLLTYQTLTSGNDEERGLFGHTLPWIEANAIEAVCDYALQAGGLRALPTDVQTRVDAMLVKGFNTTDGNGEHYGMGNCHTPFCGSFDDQAWWALAWAKAYELTGDTQYRLRSEQIFEYLAENSWDDTACGGGCWWSSSKHYKNSITNQLFFALTTQLASAYDSGSPEHEFYVDWAKKSWAWIGSGGGGSALRRGGSGLFLDGLSSAQCKRSNGNDGGANATWTYNQGVVLSALGKLYEFTRDEELLSTAYSVVQAVIAHLTLPANRTSGGGGGGGNSGTDRMLIEIGCGDSGCAEGSDHAMFKGAFMRHMGYLRRTKGVPAAHQAVYREFAAANAESAWWHSREGTIRYRRSGVPVVSTLFANDWRGPWEPSVDGNGEPVAASQIAALSLFSSLLPEAEAADNGHHSHGKGGGGGGGTGGGGSPSSPAGSPPSGGGGGWLSSLSSSRAWVSLKQRLGSDSAAAAVSACAVAASLLLLGVAGVAMRTAWRGRRAGGGGGGGGGAAGDARVHSYGYGGGGGGNGNYPYVDIGSSGHQSTKRRDRQEERRPLLAATATPDDDPYGSL